jgi:hypothetical protein
MERSEFKNADAKPTGRQIYALAAALCRHLGERFPATRFEASELLDRVRSGAVAVGDEQPSEEAAMR